jgi:hypothetical protein
MEIGTLDIAATAEPVAEMDRLGDEIAELSAHLEAATGYLLDLIREFDARGGWNNGFRSCAHWLSWSVGMDLGAARERVHVARALGSLPRLAGALARGELSYAKVRALTRVATPETEGRLLAVGRAGTACQVERIVRGWRRVDRLAEARETASRHKRRGLRVYQDEDGMVVIRGRLTPEAGAVLMQALAAARETLYRRTRSTDTAAIPDYDVSAETSSMEQQQADALTLLAESALHRIDPGAPGERYQVVVHVDAAVFATAAVASPVAVYRSVRVITSVTGARAGPPRSRTLRCSAGAITAPSTRRATRWNDSPTGSYSSGDRTGGCCPMSRLPRPSPMIPFGRSERGTKRPGFAYTRGRHVRARRRSISTWAGRSMCCIRGPSLPSRSASKARGACADRKGRSPRRRERRRSAMSSSTPRWTGRGPNTSAAWSWRIVSLRKHIRLLPNVRCARS